MRNISEIGSDFDAGAQEDAHEFLRKFVDALQNCCGVQPPHIGPLDKPYPFALFAGILMVSSYMPWRREAFSLLLLIQNVKLCLLIFVCPFYSHLFRPT